MPAYNLAPLLNIVLGGLLLALGPLMWVWLRSSDASRVARLRMLTLVTLFLTFDLVLFGAFTRLTDSGLGCPDWPGCYGSASPWGAKHHIEAAQIAMPTGPVTHTKAWIEMVHRYLAASVGVLIVVLAIGSWVERRKINISPWWATATLVWVCVQGAFGALTVTMKLFPAIVTLHLLGGMVLLMLLQVQLKSFPVLPQSGAGSQKGGRRSLMAEVAPADISSPAAASSKRAIFITLALLMFQITLGAWVSTNYAVLACTDFPTCQQSFWPAMEWREGFPVWRELGAGHEGGNITFAALTAIHYAHRLGAYVVLSALALLAYKLYRQPATRRDGQWIFALALLQLATGVSNVVFNWPLLAAVAHTGGAAALVVVLTGVGIRRSD